MRSFFSSTFGHTFALIAVCLAVMLPNLGQSSLWDVDEGVNAECSREMKEIGTWIVPTFNYELRTAKPVLLYWVQRISYQLFQVSEFSARLPAVIFSIGTVLLIASLARRMFDPPTGLLAGVILATCLEFCKLAHAATPDAPLIFFVTLTLYWFWIGHLHGSRIWFFTAPIACGLAVLTKGPAFLALTGLIIFIYLLWCRNLKRLLDGRLISGFLIFLAVAAPWYGAVAAETRGVWIKEFFGIENAGRFTNTMEGHGGWPIYYIGAILAFFAPWSVFFIMTLIHAVKKTRALAVDAGLEFHRPYRFLLCWFSVILIVFSCAATKLPNYIATLYPALAILTADFLVRWRNGSLILKRWDIPLAIGCVGLIGIAVFVGILIVAGLLPGAGNRIYPDLAPFAGLGLLLVLGAIGMGYFYRKNDRGGVISSLVASTVLFVGFMAAFFPMAFDRYKAPRELVAQSGAFDLDHDIRLASLDYTQPSVTFYAQREVKRMTTPQEAADFLATPRPGYLFLLKSTWEKMANLVTVPHEIAAHRFDFTRNEVVYVITNRISK